MDDKLNPGFTEQLEQDLGPVLHELAASQRAMPEGTAFPAVPPPEPAAVFIVTVKRPKTPGHDPQAKKTGPCPFSPECDDVTGQHHTFLARGRDAAQVRAYWESQGEHVTRVERHVW